MFAVADYDRLEQEIKAGENIGHIFGLTSVTYQIDKSTTKEPKQDLIWLEDIVF